MRCQLETDVPYTPGTFVISLTSHVSILMKTSCHRLFGVSRLNGEEAKREQTRQQTNE